MKSRSHKLHVFELSDPIDYVRRATRPARLPGQWSSDNSGNRSGGGHEQIQSSASPRLSSSIVPNFTFLNVIDQVFSVELQVLVIYGLFSVPRR
jgi:hypothetical protein